MQAILLMLLSMQIPLVITNVFGGVIAVVWLISLAEYSLLWKALLAAIIGPMAIGLCMMLNLIFGLPGMFLHMKGGILKVLSLPFLLVSGSITYLIIGIWILFVFSYSTSFISPGEPPLPYLLLAYGVATGPFSYMQSYSINYTRMRIDIINNNIVFRN